MSGGALVVKVPTIAAGSAVQRPALSMRDEVDAFGGLVLQRGADVSPTAFGALTPVPSKRGDRVRNRYSIALLSVFALPQTPLPGIRRGLPPEDIASKGGLDQDMPTDLPEAIAHVDLGRYDELHHALASDPGARLASLHGAEAWP